MLLDMEFWGAEVKSGKPLKVSPGNGMFLHLSQANIGQLKKVKGNEPICLFVNLDGKELAIGTLFTHKLPQQQFNLVFEKDFELSHNWKSGSVFFYGYKASSSIKEDGSSDEESGKHKPKAKESAEAAIVNKSNTGKQKVSTSKIKNESSDEDLMSEDDSEDDSEDEDSSDDESDESEEETPKKAEISKKRPVESSSKTPVPAKKEKATPQISDGKKGSVHVDTPYPLKPAKKTPANKPNQQTPKSGGSHSCMTCKRPFGSERKSYAQ